MSRAESNGAEKKGDIYFFKPEALTMITDKSSPLYDERIDMPLDPDLVASVMAFGIIEPIVVRKDGEDNKGRPVIQVIDGRQRVRAQLAANELLMAERQEPGRVPAVFRRCNGEEAMAVMITANEIRVDDDPITRARKLQRFLERGHTEQEACTAFGIDTRVMRNMLALLSCSAKVRDAIMRSRITLSVARDLAELPEAEQDAKLAELEGKGATGPRNAQATAEVRALKGERGRKRKAPEYRARPASKIAPLFKALEGRRLDPMQKGIMLALRWVLKQEDASVFDDILTKPQREAAFGPIED